MIATIDGLGARAEGLAEIDGRRVYVPFTLPGEQAEVTVDGERATLDAVLAPSPDRIDPFCPYFGACGGCALQHAGAATYSAFKRDLVVTALVRAGIETEVASLVDARGDGRRRATLHARKSGAGYMRPRSHDLLPIEQCPILVPGLVERAPAIARALYAAAGNCDVSVTMTDTGIDAEVRAERKIRPDQLVPVAQRLKLARLSLNTETVLQLAAPVVGMGRARVELPQRSFLQATAAAEAALAALVVDAVGKARSVADLFCGVGPFALRLAETARVTAHDSDKPAILALEKAHRTAQGVKPLVASRRDLFREALTVHELKGFDAVVLDPPRAGAEAQCRELVQSSVPRIAYVSCDPVSFARDAALLAPAYRLERVTPVDQFAWSPHVELVGVFTLR